MRKHPEKLANVHLNPLTNLKFILKIDFVFNTKAPLYLGN